MTNLWHSLLKSEYSYLKIIAEKWGIAFTAPDAREGIDQVVNALLNGDILAGITGILDPQEQEALTWLDDQGGRIAWDHFTRKFGQVREMGVGRLDRERPDLAPISPLERLWYRALIARGFFETETGPQEFAYLPDDLREIIMPLLNPNRVVDPETDFICRKAAPRERAEVLPRPGFILDQLCTLLAGIRIGLDPSSHLPDVSEPGEGFYRALAGAVGLLEGPDQTSPEKIREFLDLDDPTALGTLWISWLGGEMPGELYLLPGIQVEGDPPLEAPRIRKQLLSYLGALSMEEWWSIESFLSQVKERQPDILRAGGEYDSWFIKQTTSQEYLTGFEHWDEVEGALLRFYITGPLLWLGLIELGADDEDSPPLAFKLTPLFADFVSERSPDLPAREPDLVQLRSQGEIRMTVDVPRKTRYQIARFCDWYPVKADAYQYRLSPVSLTRAEEQGLRVPHLLSLFKNHAEAIPPNLLAALERWEKSGPQATIEPRTVLRLGSPAILKALKKSRANRYVLEQLGPTAVIIHPDSEEKVAQALMELGFFVQVDQRTSQT
jgi:hypothetical protein